MPLTREQIEAINDLKTITIHVDNWNDDVLVKQLTPMEHIELSMWARSLDIDAYYFPKLAARVLVDESRKPLFDYEKEEDLKILGEKSLDSLREIWNKCWTGGRTGDAPTEEEEAKKNS